MSAENPTQFLLKPSNLMWLKTPLSRIENFSIEGFVAVNSVIVTMLQNLYLFIRIYHCAVAAKMQMPVFTVLSQTIWLSNSFVAASGPGWKNNSDQKTIRKKKHFSRGWRLSGSWESN